MATLTSFFLSESGFASPSKALSGSWIMGIMVGASSLLAPVIAAYAHDNGNCLTASPCGRHTKAECCCPAGTDPSIDCGWIGYSCDCS